MTDGLEIAFAGERVILLPERAVWWPERRTLFIADPHFGKAATFRAAAIPVPDSTATDLQTLDRALDRTGASTLIILGDLIHARRGRCETTFEAITRWRETHATLAIRLIRGNHDVSAGAPPVAWKLAVEPDTSILGPFTLAHYPDPTGRPTLAGHLHPKVRLEARGDRLKLPCFLLRDDVLILPAFTNFADHGQIVRRPDDAVFAVTDEEVFQV